MSFLSINKYYIYIYFLNVYKKTKKKMYSCSVVEKTIEDST